MSKLRLIPYALLTTGSLLVGGGAFAQSMYDINQRQDYQQNRIEQGVRSGQISRSEQYRLEQGERAIDRAQARAMADGHVTAAERQRIDRMADREGREIYQQSHDRQQAWDRGQGWGRTDGRAFNGWNDNGSRHNGNGWDHGRNNGWDHRDADRRDWGRDHNNGSWNNGRDHNGWDRSASNGHGGWTGHNGGTGTGTPGSGSHQWGGTPGSGGTNGSHQWGGHSGSGGTTTTTGGSTGGTTATTGTTTNRSWGNRSWGGSSSGTTATSGSTGRQSYTAQASGGQSRSYSGGTRSVASRSGHR